MVGVYFSPERKLAVYTPSRTFGLKLTNDYGFYLVGIVQSPQAFVATGEQKDFKLLSFREFAEMEGIEIKKDPEGTLYFIIEGEAPQGKNAEDLSLKAEEVLRKDKRLEIVSRCHTDRDFAVFFKSKKAKQKDIVKHRRYLKNKLALTKKPILYTFYTEEEAKEFLQNRKNG